MPNAHEPVGVMEGKWAKQHSIDDAENCGVRPNPECQDDNGYRGKAGVLEQDAKTVSEILYECFHEVILLLLKHLKCHALAPQMPQNTSLCKLDEADAGV